MLEIRKTNHLKTNRSEFPVLRYYRFIYITAYLLPSQLIINTLLRYGWFIYTSAYLLPPQLLINSLLRHDRFICTSAYLLPSQLLINSLLRYYLFICTSAYPELESSRVEGSFIMTEWKLINHSMLLILRFEAMFLFIVSKFSLN